MASGTGPFKCPKCKKTSWGDLKHCPNCGESLMIECSCGASWRYIYDYKFCPSCGAKVEKEKARV
jgi:rRNA maturation endonuclease Nob1